MKLNIFKSLKKDGTNVPPDVLEKFEQVENKFEEANIRGVKNHEQKDPYRVLWEVTRPRINEPERQAGVELPESGNDDGDTVENRTVVETPKDRKKFRRIIRRRRN